jgi:hypothetical protein
MVAACGCEVVLSPESARIQYLRLLKLNVVNWGFVYRCFVLGVVLLKGEVLWQSQLHQKRAIEKKIIKESVKNRIQRVRDLWFLISKKQQAQKVN